MANAEPAKILQIVRERLKPGSEAAYAAIEEEIARASASLGCPHAYLGAQSVDGPPDVWWFNGYESSSEQAGVADAYAKNEALMAVLLANSLRKAELTLAPIEVITHYRPDASSGPPWVLGTGRFLLIAATNESHAGTAFETADGGRYLITPFETRERADAARALAGPESYVLAVRPHWSFPAQEWVAADPMFWSGQHFTR
ncbi:MAG TPA: hypothetical protein VKD69_23840 [Vicinamibacterales bacterium]|nr:hypothetical protein [Vicinamibacterales bacterium]